MIRTAWLLRSAFRKYHIGQGDLNLAALVGGLCPGLSRDVFVGVPDTEGLLLQGNPLIAGLVLVDGEGAWHSLINEGHGGFPVSLNKVGKLLHL